MHHSCGSLRITIAHCLCNKHFTTNAERCARSTAASSRAAPFAPSSPSPIASLPTCSRSTRSRTSPTHRGPAPQGCTGRLRSRRRPQSTWKSRRPPGREHCNHMAMTRLPERSVDHFLARLALYFADVHDYAFIHLVERNRHHSLDTQNCSLNFITHYRIVDSNDLSSTNKHDSLHRSGNTCFQFSSDYISRCEHDS